MPELGKGTYCFTFYESDRPVGTDDDDAGFNAIVDALTRAGLAETRCDYGDERYDDDPNHLYMTDAQIARLVRILSDPTGLNPRGAGRKPAYINVTDPELASMPAWQYFARNGFRTHIPTETGPKTGTKRKTSTRTYQKRIAALKARYVEDNPQHNMHDRVLKLPLEKALNAVI